MIKTKSCLIFACISFLNLSLFAQLQLESLVFEGLGKPFLDNVSSIDLSPDGRQVYTTSFDDQAISVFNRNLTSGQVTLLETHKNEIKGVAGLSGTYAVKVSPDGRHVYASGQFDDALVFFSRDMLMGVLTFAGMYRDGQNGIDGLRGAFQLEMSPDGNFVYATGSSDNAVAVFRRNVLSGELSLVQVLRDEQAGVMDMNFPIDLAMTPDGRQMVVSSFGDNALVLLNRNVNTGTLSFVQSFKNGSNGITDLAGAYALAISPDGQDIYLTASDANSVLHFHRFPSSGLVVYEGVQKNGQNGVSGIAGTASLTVSPDGQYLYVAGTSEDALVLFERNPDNGQLHFLEKIENGSNGVTGLDFPVAISVSSNNKDIYVAGFGANALVLFERSSTNGILNWAATEQGLNQGVKGIMGAKALDFTQNGSHCYVAGEASDALAVFERNSTTGELSFIQNIEDGNGVDGLNGAHDVLLSDNGLFLYAAGFWDNAVALFSRNPVTGILTYIDRYKDGLFGVDGLSGANSLAISPDQKHLYATGFWDSGLVLFSRDLENGQLNFEMAYLDGANGVDGLENVSDVILSADGQYLYAAGKADHAIALFSRDLNNGQLTYQGLFKNNTNGISGLEGVHKMKISADGASFYALGETSNALVHFQRNTGNGQLTFVNAYEDASAGGPNSGLLHASDLCLSNDDQRLYVTASGDNALSVYRRNLQDGSLNLEKVIYDGIDGINGLAEASSVQLSPDGQFIYATAAGEGAISIYSCAYKDIIQTTICEGEVFAWQGMTYAATGYYEELLEEGGCQRTLQLDLHVQPVAYELNVELCQGDIYILGDQAYNTSGTYTADFISTSGCDSLVTVHLAVVEAFSPTVLEERICEGDTYLLGNQELTTAGNYEALLTSTSGCDSLVQVALSVAPVVELDLTETICEGEFFVIGTTNYHQNGFYSQTFQGAENCDSMVNVLLTIIPDEAVLNEAICQGDVYEFGNDLYSEPGTYTGTYITSSGCEVQATLILEVMPELIVETQVIDDLGNGLGAINLQVEGGVPPYEFDWSHGPAVADLTNLFPGIYEVTVSDQINCQQVLSIPVNFTTSTTDHELEPMVALLWPNPIGTREMLHLQLNAATANAPLQLKILQSNGQVLREWTTTFGEEILSISGPDVPGIYLLQIQNDQGRRQSFRIAVF